MSYVYAWADSKACKFPSVDTVFELNQDSGEQPVISAIRNLDTTTVTINVLGNKLNTGNAEYYEEFLNTLSSENVTEITNVKNTYKIFIDAVIYDAKRSILEEGIKIHNIDASDTVRLLEVDRNGNCEYIPQKRFNLHVPYTFPVELWSWFVVAYALSVPPPVINPSSLNPISIPFLPYLLSVR